MNVHRLDMLALAVALAVTWGLGVLLLGIVAWTASWGTAMVTALGAIYLGYQPTLAGSIVGFLWAAIDGLIAGAVIAWIYNLVAHRRGS